MATVHPTAILEKNVQLADDVVVGPYCVIGRQCLDRRRARFSYARVVIADRVRIGAAEPLCTRIPRSAAVPRFSA